MPELCKEDLSTQAAPPVAAKGTKFLIFVATGIAILGNGYVYDSIGAVAELLSAQLHFSDLQIGLLNAIYSLPNVFVPLLGGILVDRWTGRAVTLTTALICFVGAILTAVGSNYAVMAGGRFLIGIGAETFYVSILTAVSRWFFGRHIALLMAAIVSLGRVGSYLADRSPSFAPSFYQSGWQAPLWLAVLFSLASFAGALTYWLTDRARSPSQLAATVQPTRFPRWKDLLHFRAEFWYLAGLCVAFYSAIIPFRSTFAIKYFQQAHRLALQDASRTNSYVFLAGCLAMPLLGLLADRAKRRTVLTAIGAAALPAAFLLLISNRVELWVPTVLLGISYSVVPAVLWPSVALLVHANQRGTGYGMMTVIQNLGIASANVFAGWLNDWYCASASNPEGYAPMLRFFVILSTCGVIFSALLKRRDNE